MLERRAALPEEEKANLTRFHLRQERMLIDSMERFFVMPESARGAANTFLSDLEKLVGGLKAVAQPQSDGVLVFRRNARLKGPMSAFGYDYFTDHYGAERESKLRLTAFEGLRGSGGEYAYEVLNLVDGRRTAQEIRDFVSATYGPIPLAFVVEYLRALESIKVIEEVK